MGGLMSSQVIIPGTDIEQAKNYEMPVAQIEVGPSKENPKFEIRRYSPSKWVATEQEKSNQNKAFWPLFNYISGQNDQKKKMAMTVPVITKNTDIDDKKLMHFFIGKEHWDNLPNPDNEQVFLKDMPERTHYVRAFSGRVSKESEDWNTHRQELMKDLEEAGITFSKTQYYRSGYDSPFKMWGIRNEIWIPAEDEEE